MRYLFYRKVYIMPKIYEPKVYVDIDASPPHPDNTKYRVSIGIENWNGKQVSVTKVQMVYDGKIAGRRSPSYPIGTDDYQRVNLAIEKLILLRNDSLDVVIA